jgi:hypothetical protein
MRAAFLFLAATGCGIGSIPDPKDAAHDYAEAATKGDSARIYAMMTSEGQKERTPGDVKKIVEGERQELADQAKAVTAARCPAARARPSPRSINCAASSRDGATRAFFACSRRARAR